MKSNIDDLLIELKKYLVDTHANSQEVNNIYEQVETKLKVFKLIEEHPYELGFVLSCNTYDDYLFTYKTLEDLDVDMNEVELNEEEFKVLFAYFGDKVCK